MPPSPDNERDESQASRRESLANCRSFNYQESIGTSNLEYENSSFDSSTWYDTDRYDDDDDAEFDSFFGATENGLLGSRTNEPPSNLLSSNAKSSFAPGQQAFEFVESTNLPSANNHLIKKELNRDELLFKRQQNIEELLATEMDYVCDLKIVIQVYQNEILRSPYLSRQIADTIFLNWNSLLECNQLFLKDLVKRKSEYPNGQQIERVGDILKFHFQDQMCERYTR